MNSANAFVYAVSGSYNEAQMKRHEAFINQSASMFQGAGGWLADQANKAMESFNLFLNSKAWELGKRLLGKVDGEYVSRYDIGYLGSVEALQQAQGYMRDYIMSHPGLMQDYLDEFVEGYGGEFHGLCKGVGADNLFYRRAMDGVLNLQTVDEKPQLRHTHYQESFGVGLSFRERVNVHKTYAAIDHHRAKGLFDITSPEGKKLEKKEVSEQ